MVFFVAEGQRRRHNNRIAGMYPHGVDVFHRADGNDIARRVAHGFKFNLFPPRHTALDKHLPNGRSLQPALCNAPQLCFVGRNAAAAAAQRKGRPHNHRPAHFVCGVQRLLHGSGHPGGDDRLADGLHCIAKQRAVLRFVDRFGRGAKQTHPVLRQKTVLCQLHGQRKAGLPAKAGKQAVRFFFYNNALYRRFGQRL